jgi:CheY-like chemotaxis protein
MKKVLISEPVRDLIGKDKGFLQRTDIRLLSAATNDDIASSCRTEHPDLIISQLELPGADTVHLFESLREGGLLRNTAVIIVHADKPGEAEHAQQCRADAVFRMPVITAHLLKQAQHLLDIPLRESYRVLLSLKIEGRKNEAAFFCRSENISLSGLLLETERMLAVQEHIECSFFLPGSQQIVVRAEVVRQAAMPGKSVSYRYGIRFLDLSAEARTAINRFLQKKLGPANR